MAHAVANEAIKNKAEVDETTKEIQDEKEAKKEEAPTAPSSLESKKKRYEQLSGKQAVGRYGNSEERLDKKIKELTA